MENGYKTFVKQLWMSKRMPSLPQGVLRQRIKSQEAKDTCVKIIANIRSCVHFITTGLRSIRSVLQLLSFSPISFKPTKISAGLTLRGALCQHKIGGPSNPPTLLPSPYHPLTFPSPPSYLPLPSLPPPFPFPSLPLEVGPLNIARRSGAEPQRKSNLVHFSL